MVLLCRKGGKEMVFEQDNNFEFDGKGLCNEITMHVLEEKERNPYKLGVLICEGDKNSIDFAVYSLVFPDLIVIPVGGCSTVMRMLKQLRAKLSPFGVYAFGIIDRDALSKKEIKKLYQSRGVNTTKLPFIENIICSPEVLKFVCKYKQLEYEPFLKTVEEELVKILWQRLKETLPINIAVEKSEKIEYLFFGAFTKKQEIVKEVSAKNILYSYRDKIITAIVGSHLGIRGKRAYYMMISEMIENEEYKDDLAKIFAMFIPKFELYNLEEY